MIKVSVLSRQAFPRFIITLGNLNAKYTRASARVQIFSFLFYLTACIVTHAPFRLDPSVFPVAKTWRIIYRLVTIPYWGFFFLSPPIP